VFSRGKNRVSPTPLKNRTFLSIFGLCAAVLSHAWAAGETWLVRIEEPTGLYPRTNEIVSVPYEKLGGKQQGWTVVDLSERELPWQATEAGLLFPATLIPGELPEYRVSRSEQTNTNFKSLIQVRNLGINRIELGNSFFRLMVEKQTAAIVEAFNLSAETHRTVNLVETTPEDPNSLKDDIHAAQAMGFTPIAGVPEGNAGWTTVGGEGPITKVELVETGPLRGKVLLKRANETWELTWAAQSRAMLWRVIGRTPSLNQAPTTSNVGFRFTAVSAAPFIPFDRCVNGSEYEWPNGPDDLEPPDHDISQRQWPKLPGGHAVYYCNAENYGALGIVALDTNLNWVGVGSRRFVGEKPLDGRQSAIATECALTFPEWRGSNTVLQARREFRVLRQPLLIEVQPSPEAAVPRRRAAATKADEFDGLAAALREDPPQAATDALAKAPEPFHARSLSLDGDWQLMWAEKGSGPPTNGWRSVKVPGSAHTQWLEPSKVYTRDAEWVSSKEWWYRKNFELPQDFAGKRLRLEFDATDYYTDVWLNGQRLGRHEGYIDPYYFDVSESAHPGQVNTLLVRTWAPVNYYWKHRSYTIKGAYGAVDQKPDDITPLGVTRSVRVTGVAECTIKDLAVDTRLRDDDNAEVAVVLELEGDLEADRTVELTLSPRNFSSSTLYHLRTPVRGNTVHLTLPVNKPQLWWTWDHGRPNLYTLDVRLIDESGRVLDGRSLAVGIREIERIGWNFYLNRRRMFIRGTNYYYHLYLSEMTRAAYERDVKLMLQMNINLIRLHCHFSNPQFYDTADELGILVWQDYLEAWYPEDRTFSLRAASLYDPLIRNVRNHPCIASWTTCDEESLENYRDLTKHLAGRPALLDPQRRPIVRSTGRFGDAHVYHGWYDGSIWEYTNMTEPFVSELGATCLPNFETLIQFMPNAWPIREHQDDWFFRRLQIPEAIRAWGEPGEQSLQEYIPRTQAYVSRLFQIALERSRRLKYQPAGGICHFHAIDIWPSVTMAAIDFDRRPTKVFYTVQRSFAPVCASFEYGRDAWKEGESFGCGIWAINDKWDRVPNATVRWRIEDSAGTEQKAGEWSVSMPEDSVQRVGAVDWKASGKGHHELHAEVRDQAGHQVSENIFEFEVN
jgi:beta-mannosidase